MPWLAPMPAPLAAPGGQAAAGAGDQQFNQQQSEDGQQNTQQNNQQYTLQHNGEQYNQQYGQQSANQEAEETGHEGLYDPAAPAELGADPGTAFGFCASAPADKIVPPRPEEAVPPTERGVPPPPEPADTAAAASVAATAATSPEPELPETEFPESPAASHASTEPNMLPYDLISLADEMALLVQRAQTEQQVKFGTEPAAAAEESAGTAGTADTAGTAGAAVSGQTVAEEAVRAVQQAVGEAVAQVSVPPGTSSLSAEGTLAEPELRQQAEQPAAEARATTASPPASPPGLLRVPPALEHAEVSRAEASQVMICTSIVCAPASVNLLIGKSEGCNAGVW